MVKNRCFNLPLLYLAPPLEVIPLEFLRDFWLQKTSAWAIVGRCLCDRFSHLCRTPTCDKQTDRLTDRQTHDDSIYLASIASRGKNDRSKPSLHRANWSEVNSLLNYSVEFGSVWFSSYNDAMWTNRNIFFYLYNTRFTIGVKLL